MKLNPIKSILLAILVSACATASYPPPDDAIPLATLFAAPLDRSTPVIKTCGWATKKFENVQITANRNRNSIWQKNKVGFGVGWLPEEPRAREPEWRCVTGKVVPACGWGNLKPDEICLSTGHGFQREILQTELGRD